MKNIMTRAWEIAREGQKKFGGKVKEYFQQALIMAWKEVKNMANRVKGVLPKVQLPAITEGSEKQIKWAESIRKEAASALMYEVTHEEWKEGQPKRSVKELLKALVSKETIQEHLDNSPEFLVERRIESMNALLDRYERAVEILSNDDAKFWIDNRNNQEKNYQFKRFTQYVSTGVKTF